MAGSLAQSGLAPELIRLVSDAVFKSDESGCGVVSMRATCAIWRTALKSSEPCWRKWTEWRYPLIGANIGFLGDGRDYFKIYCTQLRAESPYRSRCCTAQTFPAESRGSRSPARRRRGRRRRS